MPQSLSRVLIHIIFSTKGRFRYIKPAIEQELFAYIAAILNEHDAQPIKIDGTEDHVHILCGFPRTIALYDLLEKVKKRSSKWIKTKGSEYRGFSWQGGYGVFSVGESGVERVKKYITDQKKHHRKVSFKDEFREFLARYRVEYDERYVWG
ncbi:IS200/IS605 family transposase [Myxococcota bacterium]